MIKIEGVSIQRGRHQVLKSVTATFGARITVLMGENGSGKSSLMQAVVGILPHAGEIEVSGIAVKPRNSADLARLIGYAPQSIRWPRGMAVADVLVLAARLRKVSRARVGPEVERCLEMTGLSGLRERRVASLSGGQHRRLTVAQALVHRPEMLVLDEPTAEADPQFSDDFAALVQEFDGGSILVSTNSVDDAVRWGSDVIRLGQGAIDRLHLEWDGERERNVAVLRHALGAIA